MYFFIFFRISLYHKQQFFIYFILFIKKKNFSFHVQKNYEKSNRKSQKRNKKLKKKLFEECNNNPYGIFTDFLKYFVFFHC